MWGYGLYCIASFFILSFPPLSPGCVVLQMLDCNSHPTLSAWPVVRDDGSYIPTISRGHGFPILAVSQWAVVLLGPNFWVHICDFAAQVAPNDPRDQAAASRTGCGGCTVTAANIPASWNPFYWFPPGQEWQWGEPFRFCLGVVGPMKTQGQPQNFHWFSYRKMMSD